MIDTAELERLLLAVACGDQQAFQRFYRETSAHLYPVALRILREDGRAADCLQDAFLKIWLKASEYRAGRSPMAWAAAIVRYQAIDLLRRMPKDEPGWEEPDWEREEWGAVHNEAALYPAERKRIEDCLQKMTTEQRQAIVQAFYRAATYEEVATHFGAALGTVKSWIRRGLLFLRDCLQHESA
ncbi:sigma-70 family RNA polymerase sigma factor [Acidithiobacillus sp. CV18-2]|uniref:Sigma-70 family RNA polymerase sigma factor n=1 Tax=Igneacidithiobacillus copahuensis TaxID=2724909 RepID=A0AAE2YNG6_9PROT|nr:sigma-70 family RNA polymerase sigma factor [Igneacidithiobacillus copahuensis]MBU2754670.1 sigma-70 family RNA polymerase sigma factor [Acidithiobacillus sp. CV18-3]MBU2758607.1 sigma-70 family RNA polymerase sigma factor [Acidithiobacillus sp. BN09-2]MBU2776407.1 sigma-70 family RNA polymerase sigma factor [Acidithiobacillus sp. CV18-2]MBU2797295.1 sigma-70 family RNA polymerase sigma factor [Acidithiobacillus sp. VAN18-2]MBU2799227.1 sigma-70 family RNA polymerase sigma factor [Acidithio